MATFTADGLLKALESTFDKSSRDDFAAFLVEIGMPRKWFIASDYCLHDQGKVNDVIAFTAFPGGTEFPKIDSNIQSRLPKDWKKTKGIDDATAQFLRDGNQFHFCFIIDRDRKLFSADGSDAERVVIRDAVQELLQLAESWPDRKKHAADIAAFRKVKQQVQSKSFNLALFKDLCLTSLFAGFVSYVFARYAKAELVSWFSDRDAILTWAEGAAHAYYATVMASLCRQNKIQEPEVAIGDPKIATAGSGMFYDPFVRVPDFYAGGLASWDIGKNLVADELPKYREIVEKVICDNRRLVVLILRIPGESAQFTRLAITRTAVTQPENAESKQS
jgi:hypothetical protein